MKRVKGVFSVDRILLVRIHSMKLLPLLKCSSLQTILWVKVNYYHSMKASRESCSKAPCIIDLETTVDEREGPAPRSGFSTLGDRKMGV
jgi:hypothetical protein